MSLEQELKLTLKSLGYLKRDNSEAMDRADFTVEVASVKFDIECKECLTPYNCANWGINPNRERFVFIIDELTVRRSFLHDPKTLFILKKSDFNYYVFNMWEFTLVKKKRVNRIFDGATVTQDERVKGKILIDLRGLKNFTNIVDVVEYLPTHLTNLKTLATNLQCLNSELDSVENLSMKRGAEHRNFDLTETR